MTPKHFTPGSFLARFRAKVAAQTAAALTEALHADQPTMTQGLEVLGTGFFGDLRVELHGSVEYAGSRVSDVYLEDVTVAGTTISVRDCLDGKDWERLEEDARQQVREATYWEGVDRGRQMAKDAMTARRFA
ncbi:hypothetical protein K6V92_10435 [Cupriavidus respiraculi]|uniref:hypothetical protein n=1 Tax=Cupriavidus respiraculi TaxID=195930 RepID=UPI001C94FEC9|nr:hypothetical protein [Cupriavidus respiraculi]MBY4947035.1 hypothetical protein [Cupriavidus respiraculi]